MNEFITTHLPFPESYTPEQQELIDKVHAAALKEQADDPTFFSVAETTQLHRRAGGKQVFAVFTSAAYELWCRRIETAESSWRPKDTWEYLPARTSGGLYVRSIPDEGSCGVLHLMRCVQRNGKPDDMGWMTIWLDTGWLYLSELDKPAGVIAETIADEVMAGKNYLTGIRERG